MVGDYQKAVVDQEEVTRGRERRGGVWGGGGGGGVGGGSPSPALGRQGQAGLG